MTYPAETRESDSFSVVFLLFLSHSLLVCKKSSFSFFPPLKAVSFTSSFVSSSCVSLELCVHPCIHPVPSVCTVDRRQPDRSKAHRFHSLPTRLSFSFSAASFNDRHSFAFLFFSLSRLLSPPSLVFFTSPCTHVLSTPTAPPSAAFRLFEREKRIPDLTSFLLLRRLHLPRFSSLSSSSRHLRRRLALGGRIRSRDSLFFSDALSEMHLLLG